MKFAKFTFYIAGIYGLLVITPLYFIFDKIGQQDPPPITHPGFYYGFVGCALAWQLAFLVIATDPIRFRLMMLPAIVEKITYAIAIPILYSQHRVHPADLALSSIDALFSILFLISFLRTKPHSTTSPS
jgi:hypothetical protein